MNKTDVLEIIQKRTTQLTVISVVFVGMMVFLVPSLIEEANAVIIGPFATTGTTFSDIKGGMTTGKFIEYPTAVLGGTVVIWTTDSVGFFGGLEQGTVLATVKQSGETVGPVAFSFSNPVSGKNTCGVAPDRGPLKLTCHIPSSGGRVIATYEVSFRNQDNNGYCGIINNLGGVELSKVIREKLHC